jgi:hypothetical protein
VNFRDLQHRLIEVARERIRSGLFTERGLAFISDISQPHLHNALKNIRTLSPAMADRLLRALDLNVAELMWDREGDRFRGFRAVPVLANRLGAGSDPDFRTFRGYLPFPANLVNPLVDPVVVRLSADLVMPKPFAANDLLLLDQNPDVRRRPCGKSAWVVDEYGTLRVRYVRMGDTGIYVANELTLANPVEWKPVALRGRDILEIVRARIVWISREMEFSPAGSPEQTC